MLEALARAEAELPAMLETSGWRSLRIDYHPPFVDRLWRPWGTMRISLHRIHPCAPGEALFHPHRWPAAVRVLSGTYEMAVGYGSGAEAPPVSARMIADATPTGGLRYEMTHPDAWHSVRPLGGVVHTVMVTGAPWPREAPRSARPLRRLDEATRASLLAFFREVYTSG